MAHFRFYRYFRLKCPFGCPFCLVAAFVLMGVTHKLFSVAFNPRFSHNKVIATLAPLIFVLIYALSGLIHAGTGGLQDVWLACAAILFWWIVDRTSVQAMLALLIAVSGTLFEIFLVSIHGFSYFPQYANLFGVPSWLPWLYASASISVSLVVRYI